jgi:hypothetical protein
MPIGANKSSLGAHAPRDLACPNQLCVAREKGSILKGVVQTGNRKVVTPELFELHVELHAELYPEPCIDLSHILLHILLNY